MGIELRSATRQLDRIEDRGSSFCGLLTRVEIGHIRMRCKNVPEKVGH